MAIANVFMIWVCSMLFFTSNLVNGLGVNWGRNTSNQLIISGVVSMIMNVGFDKVKLYDSEPEVIGAFAKTGIELMIGIPNEQLYKFTNSTDTDNAKLWVKENVTRHINNGVNIKYVAVGNEPFLKYYDDTYFKRIFPALKNIQKALDEYHPGDKIKATVPFSDDVYVSETKVPSGGKFREDIKDIMLPILKFLDTNDSPFVINIIPFNYYLRDTRIPAGFSTFYNEEIQYFLVDNYINYTNSFDLCYDTVVMALTKAGFPKMRVTVGEVGWPSDGNNVTNGIVSEYFFKRFMEVHAKGMGTPLRPGPFDYYLYNLIDENKRSTHRGPFERHWGLYEYDGKPKFRTDFTGAGNIDYTPVIKSQTYMPTRWCVLNKDKMKTNDRALVDETFKAACRDADCSSLEYGSACNTDIKNYDGNVSYAFNMLYQTYAVKEPDMCTSENIKGRLRGLGEITTVDPSIKRCKFIVQIISASNRLYNVSTTIVVVAFLLLFFAL